MTRLRALGLIEILLLAACILLTLLLAALLARPPREFAFALADKAQGFYPTESFPEHAGQYRWTNGNGFLDMPNPGGLVALQIDAAGGPDRTVQIEITAGATTLAFPIAPELRRYHVLLQPNHRSRLEIHVLSPTFTQAGDDRALGIVISRVHAAGGAMPAENQSLLALAVGATWAVGLSLRRSVWIVALTALAAGVGAAITAALTWTNPQQTSMIWLWSCGAALVLAAPAAVRVAHTMRWRALANHSAVIAAVVGGGGVLLAARMFNLIDRYAVNMLYSDEWDIFNPLFRGQGALAMFLYQHGPHRQGLGGLVLLATATLTNWNSRDVAFVIGGIMVAAMIAALVLKRRLFGHWDASDLAIPLIYCTIAHYEALVVVPNPAHGALPALMAVLVPLAWTINRPLWRYSGLIVLHGLMVFTGFGIFMGLIIPAIVGIECLHAIRSRRQWLAPAIALGCMTCVWGLFALNYQFGIAAGCLAGPSSQPQEYPLFVALMFARFVGFDARLAPLLAGTAGGALLLACLILVFAGTARIVRDGIAANPTTRAIVVLIGFSLLFTTNTAFGRICGGVDGGQASRYMPLLTPAFLGLYFASRHLRPAAPRRLATAILIALLLPIPLPVRGDDLAAARGFANLKRTWSACYLVEHSVERCTQQAGLPIYPNNTVGPKLDYLEAHQLNFFAENSR